MVSSGDRARRVVPAACHCWPLLLARKGPTGSTRGSADFVSADRDRYLVVRAPALSAGGRRGDDRGVDTAAWRGRSQFTFRRTPSDRRRKDRIRTALSSPTVTPLNTVHVRFARRPTNFSYLQMWDRCMRPPSGSGRSQSRRCARGRRHVALVPARPHGIIGRSVRAGMRRELLWRDRVTGGCYRVP